MASYFFRPLDRSFILMAGVLLTWIGFGCAAPSTKTPELTPTENLDVSGNSEVLSRLGSLPGTLSFSSAQELARLMEVSERFHSSVKLRQVPAVDRFLKKLGFKLFNSDRVGPVQESVNVSLIDKVQGKWRNFAVPQNRFYISYGLLKQFEYESELAAAIALQIGHLRLRHLAKRIEFEVRKPEDVRDLLPPGAVPDLFGPRGVFYFSDEMEKASIAQAVGILYRCGYDPRGIVLIFEKYLANLPESPFGPSTLSHLIDEARKQVAHLAPLRNPTLRSDEFLVMMKKIRTHAGIKLEANIGTNK